MWNTCQQYGKKRCGQKSSVVGLGVHSGKVACVTVTSLQQSSYAEGDA